MNKLIKPAKLAFGDTIGMIAPSYVVNPEKIELAAQNLRQLGFRVKFSDNLFSNTDGYGGSVGERTDDFNAMIADPQVKALFFGGGEICNEILPHVDYDNIRRNPKIICSYSDSTTILEAVFFRSSLVTFYGASPRVFENPTTYNIDSFTSRLMTADTTYKANSIWRALTPGGAEGRLIGGYLVNFAAMLGGRYFGIDRNEKYILFIEDHEKFSKPAVVSKWFSHIEQSGLFKNVTGLIFGHYSTEDRPLIDEILTRIGNRYSIPVVRCEDFGHGDNAAVLPVGIRCELPGGNNPVVLLESGVV